MRQNRPKKFIIPCTDSQDMYTKALEYRLFYPTREIHCKSNQLVESVNSLFMDVFKKGKNGPEFENANIATITKDLERQLVEHQESSSSNSLNASILKDVFDQYSKIHETARSICKRRYYSNRFSINRFRSFAVRIIESQIFNPYLEYVPVSFEVRHGKMRFSNAYDKSSGILDLIQRPEMDGYSWIENPLTNDAKHSEQILLLAHAFPGQYFDTQPQNSPVFETVIRTPSHEYQYKDKAYCPRWICPMEITFEMRCIDRSPLIMHPNNNSITCQLADHAIGRFYAYGGLICDSMKGDPRIAFYHGGYFNQADKGDKAAQISHERKIHEFDKKDLVCLAREICEAQSSSFWNQIFPDQESSSFLAEAEHFCGLFEIFKGNHFNDYQKINGGE